MGREAPLWPGVIGMACVCATVAAAGAWIAALMVAGKACPGHGGQAHHMRGLRVQWLWGNALASYLVSSDFCGSGGGPPMGELHLGGNCNRKKSHHRGQ